MDVLLHFPFMAMILKSFTKPPWLPVVCHNNVLCQYEELSNDGQMFKPPPNLVCAAIVSAGGGTSDILVIPTLSPVQPAQRESWGTLSASTLLHIGQAFGQVGWFFQPKHVQWVLDFLKG